MEGWHFHTIVAATLRSTARVKSGPGEGTLKRRHPFLSDNKHVRQVNTLTLMMLL